MRLNKNGWRAWLVVCLAGALGVMFSTESVARTATVKPAEVKVTTSSRCLRVGRKLNLRLGAVGSRNGPFFRAVVKRGMSLTVGRNFIHAMAYVAEIKALRPGWAVVEIQRRYFTGGIKIDATGQPVSGGGRGFYSPWQPIKRINFVVTAGPCPR
jgi:hypothetical protein